MRANSVGDVRIGSLVRACGVDDLLQRAMGEKPQWNMGQVV